MKILIDKFKHTLHRS